MTTFLLETYYGIKKLFSILFLSITDYKFYDQVYREYRGYGIKFIASLCFIGTILACLIILYKISPIDNYFETRTPTNSVTKSLDAIINEWQALEYDGANIVSTGDDPILLRAGDKVLVAIDPDNKLNGSTKKSIPMVFGKSRLLINLSLGRHEGTSEYQASHEYVKIFGNTRKTLDDNEIFSLAKSVAQYFDKILIFFFMPALFMIGLVTIALEKIFTMVVIYFVMKMFIDQKIRIASAIRMVLFSCGIVALLLPIAISVKGLESVANVMQIWTSALLIFAVASMRRKGNILME